MKRIVAPLVLTLMLSCNAYAQKYVIELEGFVFDRDISQAERKQIEERIQDVPDDERSGARTEETLAVLRQNSRELFHFKNSALAATSEPVSQQVDAEAMCLEANFLIVERKADTVTIDCQLASGYVNRQLTHSHRVVSPVTVHLGHREQIAGGGAQAGNAKEKTIVAIQQIMLLHVREATDEDLKLKKVTETFEAKLQQKRKPIPLPGGKLSMLKAR